MTLTYKDLKVGDCWIFADKIDRHCAPLIMTSSKEPGIDPGDLPDHWEYDYLAPEHAWADRPVELLHHYSTHPSATPLRVAFTPMFKYVPAHTVKPGQWYIGIWSFDSAREVAQDVNKDRENIRHYRTGVGPVEDEEDDRYVVVHIVDHDERQSVRLMRTHGLTGEECLRRFEMAQRTESLCRTSGGYVSTNAACALNEAQVRAAQQLWALELRERIALEKEKERLQVLIDVQDID